jgi:hypothetical protein
LMQYGMRLVVSDRGITTSKGNGSQDNKNDRSGVNRAVVLNVLSVEDSYLDPQNAVSLFVSFGVTPTKIGE